jgi:hypothetical protein
MAPQVGINELGGHEYLARVDEAGDRVEAWFSMDPATLGDFGVADIDERQVVERTIAAAYTDYSQALPELLGR